MFYQTGIVSSLGEPFKFPTLNQVIAILDTKNSFVYIEGLTLCASHLLMFDKDGMVQKNSDYIRFMKQVENLKLNVNNLFVKNVCAEPGHLEPNINYTIKITFDSL